MVLAGRLVLRLVARIIVLRVTFVAGVFAFTTCVTFVAYYIGIAIGFPRFIRVAGRLPLGDVQGILGP